MSKEIGREKGFDTQVENASELLKKGEDPISEGIRVKTQSPY